MEDLREPNLAHKRALYNHKELTYVPTSYIHISLLMELLSSENVGDVFEMAHWGP